MLDVRVDGLALDRPGPDERDLDRQVVEVLRARAEQALHLRAALDLEVADGVGVLDLLVDVWVVERDPRRSIVFALRFGDLHDAVLDRREHPEPEQVDLQEARVGARVLVPLADLAPLHGRGLHRDEVDQRPARDDHAARVLGDVPREAGDLLRQRAECPPAPRAELLLAVGELRDLLRDALRAALGDPREPLELCERQPERLPEVADRAAGAVRREARDERGVLVPVALGERDDQLLADVAREVEVDVGHRVELAVQEPTEREPRRDWVDVRETGQVADERADRAAPSAARRQRVARRVAAAHLPRHVGGELEHLPVEQEEPREPELVDQGELLVEPRTSFSLVAVGASVARLEGTVAHLGQLGDRGLVAVGEVRVAVAELLREVELEARGELGGALDGLEILWEPLHDRLGRQQDALVVPTPLLLRRFERPTVADRDHRVLEERAAAVVRVDVARDDGLDADRLCQLPQQVVAPCVATLVGPLELDEEAVASEDRRQLGRAVRAPDREPVPRAAGEADQALVVSCEQVAIEGRWHRLGRFGPRSRVRRGEQPAEVCVPSSRLYEQRHVRPVRERHLGSCDRPHAECLRRMRKLERPGDAVVVGQSERLVSELRRPSRQLLRV